MPRWGLCFGPAWGSSIADLLKPAQAAEAAGFSRLTTGEYHSDPLSWAALLLAATHEVPIATTIASIAPRHPTVVAEALAALRDVHGDRLELGLGVSHPSLVTEELNLPQPGLDDLEHYVRAVRSVLAGSPGEFGRYRVPRHQRDRRAPGAPPILVATLGARAVQRATTFADGMILTWTPDTWTRSLLHVAREGDADATAHRMACWAVLPTFVSDDLLAARRGCAVALLPYLGMPSYQRMLATALDDPEKVAAAASATDADELLEVLGGRTLARIAAIGSPHRVASAIEMLYDLGVDEVILYPLDTGHGWKQAVEACITRCAPTG